VGAVDADSALALTAVIVHRSQPEACVRTGRALLRQAEGLRLVIVDNGSPPVHLAALRRELPEADIIEVGHNAGFGPAANVGLRRWLEEGEGAGPWVVVCPHDAVGDHG
jgi:N-acetylglucosaminyl-diphospho-decaprenol L-rhamnosyltransferase